MPISGVKNAIAGVKSAYIRCEATLVPHVRIMKLHCYCKHSVLCIG